LVRKVAVEGKLWGRKSKEFKVHSLIDKVYKRLNLYIAFEKVKANRGASGVDRVSLEEFERNLTSNIEEIHRLLYEDKYTPQPVRRVWIPKPDGDKRPLGVPTVRDRIVQQAILNRLEQIFEPEFSDCSYGFRKGRSCHQAIEKVEGYIKDGYQWVVEVDIRKFFDTLDHKLLMKLVNEEVSDGRVLDLIEGFLKSGVMEDMKVEYQTNGTPQGGVISPMLANIYLNPFDKQMMKEGFKVVRYADDIVVLGRTKREAEQALLKAKEILEGMLELALHPEKTKIVHKTQGFEFLGYRFKSWYRDYKEPREKAIRSFKDKVRWITRRHQPKSMTQVIAELKPVVRGWGNYFLKGNCHRIYAELDFWMRNRITAFKLKKMGGYAHRKYTYDVLRDMGMLFLKDLLYTRRLELSPAKGQRLRRAGCGKSARPVR
jgi:group II intron reverse transcriptase/maturase